MLVHAKTGKLLSRDIGRIVANAISLLMLPCMFGASPISGRLWLSSDRLIEDYRDRTRLQKELKGVVGNCIRPNLTPGLVYRCITAPTSGSATMDTSGQLLPPYPLGIPLNGLSIDLGYVPLSDAIKGAEIVKSWHDLAARNPVLRCEAERCDKLVEFVEKTEDGPNISWLNVCKVYRFNANESLPIDCFPIVIHRKGETWVIVPGQCSFCGGHFPVSFMYLSSRKHVAEDALLKEIQFRIAAKPWSMETKRFRNSVVGYAGLGPARFLTGWRESITIRFDIEDTEHGMETFLSMFMMVNRLNTLDPRDIHEAPEPLEEDYRKRLRALTLDAHRKVCADSGGMLMVQDSAFVVCQ